MMKIRFPFIVFILLASVFLPAGCAEPVNPGTAQTSPPVTATTALATQTPWPSATATPSPRATQTRQPTLTPTRPTATLTVTDTPTLPSETGLNFQCLDIAQEIPPEASVENTLVIEGKPSYLWNIDSDFKYILPEADNQVVGFFAVSPDGQWLAYSQEIFDPQITPHADSIISETLRIVSVDGQQQLELPWEEDWFWSGPWRDNETLLIRSDNGPLWLNPFTGERTKAEKVLDVDDFPDRDDLISLWTLAFNSARGLVVYPDTAAENYVIWDIQARQEIARVPFPAVYDYEPVWSPDGAQFVVASATKLPTANTYIPDDELYSIRWDGQVTQLTHFSEYFEGVYIETFTYKWSPDGRYFAFWAEFNPPEIRNTNLTLTVLDMQTQEVTNYCVQAHFGQGTEAPIWAPNSQQLLVRAPSETEESRIVLVDIVEGFAMQIAGGGVRAYWMAPTP